MAETQHCTRCDGTGFLNVEQIGDVFQRVADTVDDAHAAVLLWLQQNLLLLPDAPQALRDLMRIEPRETDVSVCDCCGNGADSWHGDPGEHDHSHVGKNGPYASNGGLWECW